MRPGLLATEAEIQRFHAEAKTAAGLQHPNIVAIHEVGEIDGLHYFSMDFVDGPSLAELVRERALSSIEAAEYVKTLAETVHYAHSRGVIHRDLKPSNVLVDSAGRPRITDFGLAHPLDTDSRATVQGSVVGTPAYMPPEQASGEGTRIGPASDVYSLGAILYELLTGLPPFRGATQLETVRMVLEERPAAPRKLNDEVPRGLDAVCMRCLEKHTAGRYLSAADLAGELDRFLRGKKLPWWSTTPRWQWVAAALALIAPIVSVLRTEPPKPSAVRGPVTVTIERTPAPPPAGNAPKILKAVPKTPHNPPPGPVASINSTPGAGNQRIFTFRYPLSDNAPEIAAAQIVFRENRPSGLRDCAIIIDPASRKISLQWDPERGPQLRVSGDIGSASPLENSVCSVNLADLVIEPIRNIWQIRIPVTFKPGFDGPKTIHSWLSDKAGRITYEITQR
jgi:serine/threonine protein kinase